MIDCLINLIKVIYASKLVSIYSFYYLNWKKFRGNFQFVVMYSADAWFFMKKSPIIPPARLENLLCGPKERKPRIRVQEQCLAAPPKNWRNGHFSG